MTQFCDQHWGTHLDQRGPSAKHNFASDIHMKRGSKEFEKDTHDDDNGTEGGGNSSSAFIADPAEEDEWYDAANGTRCAEEAQG